MPIHYGKSEFDLARTSLGSAMMNNPLIKQARADVMGFSKKANDYNKTAFDTLLNLAQTGGMSESEEASILGGSRDSVVGMLRAAAEGAADVGGRRGTTTNPLAIAAMQRDATLAGADEMAKSLAQLKFFRAAQRLGAAQSLAGTANNIGGNLANFANMASNASLAGVDAYNEGARVFHTGHGIGFIPYT
jgi:hypothetical protein